MPQDERVDCIAGNPAPDQPDVKENKGARNRIAGDPAPAPRSWLRNINDFVRRQPREYDVARFG